jgi:hypothetical protein
MPGFPVVTLHDLRHTAAFGDQRGSEPEGSSDHAWPRVGCADTRHLCGPISDDLELVSLALDAAHQASLGSTADYLRAESKQSHEPVPPALALILNTQSGWRDSNPRPLRPER